MVEPVDGEETVTVAKQGSADNKTQQKKILIFAQPWGTKIFARRRRWQESNLERDQLRFNALQQSLVHDWK